MLSLGIVFTTSLHDLCFHDLGFNMSHIPVSAVVSSDGVVVGVFINLFDYVIKYFL